ncbi:MAG: 4-(cytidine 5'-diphospho)-2-C-methyl-D-erythritol kinase, partial [bacterium]|nr:4-(cytidine 5'-diphospho)-2-C-methyl-D-erythritol kinase [bacterium]
KAAKLLQQEANVSYGARHRVTKKIPMGAGLGGGSSNAATVLKGLNQLWGLNWPLEKLASLGVQLGADIPFFIYDGPAQIEGIGDKITSLTKLPNLAIILINPGIHVSTPWAYSAWDRRFGGNPLTPKNRSVTSARAFAKIVQELHNDFEAVVIPEHPEIQGAKEALKNAGSKGVLMSGSGSTVFGIFETKDLRDRALGKIEKREKWQVFAVENWGVDKR